MTEHDTRVQSLINEAKRLRYSRRQVFRSGAALGLSAAGIQTALRGSGHAIAAPRATRYQTGGSLTILAGSYFVPEAQDFFVQQVEESPAGVVDDLGRELRRAAKFDRS